MTTPKLAPCPVCGSAPATRIGVSGLEIAMCVNPDCPDELSCEADQWICRADMIASRCARAETAWLALVCGAGTPDPLPAIHECECGAEITAPGLCEDCEAEAGAVYPCDCCDAPVPGPLPRSGDCLCADCLVRLYPEDEPGAYDKGDF